MPNALGITPQEVRDRLEAGKQVLFNAIELNNADAEYENQMRMVSGRKIQLK
jgi:hypothetical protein